MFTIIYSIAPMSQYLGVGTLYSCCWKRFYNKCGYQPGEKVECNDAGLHVCIRTEWEGQVRYRVCIVVGGE